MKKMNEMETFWTVARKERNGKIFFLLLFKRWSLDGELSTENAVASCEYMVLLEERLFSCS